ncbi:MAG: hypothetical protein ABSF53_03190 [Terracidiphilus sp.]|jgi:hypothetical protein
MLRSTRLLFCLTISLCAQVLFAQTSNDRTEDDATIQSTTPAALIYVSNITNPTDYEHFISNVYAYTAAANGELKPVPGSPFSDNVAVEGVNGKYLFAMEADNLTIDSYLMEANGAIEKVSSTNTETYNPGECGSPGQFKIDHSGTVLYNSTVDPDCNGTHFQFFKIASATGKLSYEGATSEDDPPAFEIDFLGNNEYAYAPICASTEFSTSAGIYGYKRPSNGELTNLNLNVNPPETPQKGNFYCPYTLSTDPTHNMAMLLEDEDASGDLYGQPVIGVFSADANGNLTTTSTYHNMPAVKGGYFLRMSPSGKLLAATGTDGLEIFHFNGANPVTKYTTLLSGENLAQAAWDSNNHLYVVGGTANGKGKLWVYTVTPTSVVETPGSPYAIPNPYSVIIQTK